MPMHPITVAERALLYGMTEQLSRGPSMRIIIRSDWEQSVRRMARRLGRESLYEFKNDDLLGVHIMPKVTGVGKDALPEYESLDDLITAFEPLLEALPEANQIQIIKFEKGVTCRPHIWICKR